MTPDEIVKLIPDEAMRALRLAVLLIAPNPTDDEIRAAIAAALAAWPHGRVTKYALGCAADAPPALYLPVPREKIKW